MKIGTIVHVLELGGRCSVGLVLAHDAETDEAELHSFRLPDDEEPLARMGRGTVAHDPECNDMAEALTWHTADECRWRR